MLLVERASVSIQSRRPLAGGVTIPSIDLQPPTERDRLSSDGPIAALTYLARSFGTRTAEQDIVRAVALHPKPSSIVALIDVATQIGLEPKPVKSSLEGLGSVTHPAVVHLAYEDGSGGFAVLEGFDGPDPRIWDSVGGTRTVPSATFAGAFSGIAVQFAPVEESGKPSALAWLTEGERPDLRGRGSSVLRGSIGVLIALLVLRAIAVNGHARLPLIAFVLLSVAGLVVTSYMTIVVATYQGPFSPGICRSRGLIDCTSVMTSRFAYIFGLPLSELGIAFYSSILLMVGISTNALVTPAAIGTAFIAAAVAALVLIGVQVIMQRFCSLCLIVHLINVIAAATWLLADTPAPFRWYEVAFGLTAFALLFLLVLFVGIPYFTKSASLHRLESSFGRMASSPFASLAQLHSEAPVELDPRSMAIEIGEGSGNEITVFVHANCKQCGPVLRELLRLREALAMSVHVAFPPKDEREVQLSATFLAVGLTHGPEMALQAFEAAKSDFVAAVDEPVATLADRLSIDRASLNANLERAQRMAVATQDFARTHVEGTPAIFFNGRAYRGPISHLLTLLNGHADLLPPRAVT